MTIGFLLIITSLLVEVIKDRNKLLKKPVDWWGWITILILLFGAYVTYKENRNSDSEISSLTNKADSLKDQIGNLQRYNKYAQDHSEFMQQRHEDSLIKYGREHSSEIKSTTLTLIDRFTRGTNSIILQAQSDAKKLRDTIKVMKQRQLPNIAAINGYDTLQTFQAGDTFHILLAVVNNGGSVAKKLTFDTYYLLVEKDYLFEYEKSICSAVNLEISQASKWISLRGGNGYLPSFKFDPNRDLQFILILGSYENDDINDKVKKELVICYSWNSTSRKWGVANNSEEVKDLHNSKKVIYFKTQPY